MFTCELAFFCSVCLLFVSYNNNKNNKQTTAANHNNFLCSWIPILSINYVSWSGLSLTPIALPYATLFVAIHADGFCILIINFQLEQQKQRILDTLFKLNMEIKRQKPGLLSHN